MTAMRDEICIVATRLFAQHGLEGTTMRAIAKAMGVSTMAPYHYFRDKDEILAAVLQRAFEQFVGVVENAVSGEDSAVGRARAKRRAYCKLAMEKPGIYRVMFEMPHPRESDYPGMAEAINRARAAMREAIEELIAEGAVAGDPEFVSHMFWSAVHGPLSLYLAGKLNPAIDVEKMIDTQIQGVYASLRPEREKVQPS
jgi:AcrR family transcriptional regulator